MYKVASANAQNAARRLRLSDLCERGYEPSDEERRENLKMRAAQVEREILALPAGHPKRAELGQEKFRIQEEMRAIRPKWKMRDLGDYMLKHIKSQVTKHQWAMWLKESEQLQAEAAALIAEANDENQPGTDRT